MEEFLASKTAWLGGFLAVSSLWTIDMMFNSMRVSLRSCCYGEKKKVQDGEDVGAQGSDKDPNEEDMDTVLQLPSAHKGHRRTSRRYSTRERSLKELNAAIESI